MSTITLSAFIAVLCTLLSSTVRAETRVAVHAFHGPSAVRLRDDVVNLLERQPGITIVSRGQLEHVADELGVDSFSSDGRQTLARELHVSAFLAGRVQRRRGKLMLTVLVYDGAHDARVERAQLIGSNAAKLSAAIKHRLWRKSGRAILHTSAPAPVDDATPAPAAASKPDLVVTEAESEAVRDQVATNAERLAAGPGEALRAFVGVGSPYRSLAYRQAITPSLADYQLNGTPMVDVHVAFQPARAATDAWPSWFGIDARAQIALSSPTRDRDGNRFKSRYDAFTLGLLARVPLGRHYVSVFSGYAINRFTISGQNADVRPPTPSVDYRSIRSGLGAEFALWDGFMLGLDAAWLNYLSVGEIGKWFPRASAGGVELAMSATYRMTQAVFTRAAAAYQRTYFDFHARPGDRNVAGGAIDQSLTLSLAMGLCL